MEFDKQKRPKACVGVMIFKEGKVLMGKRRGSHGHGEYSFAGGHIEFGESFEDCAKRETMEEAGIEIQNITFLCLANIQRHEGRQDMLLGVKTDWKSGEPKTDENEKIEDWDWYDLNNLPSPIFYPAEVIFDSYKSGKNYFDIE